jgi:hypothetical protein
MRCYEIARACGEKRAKQGRESYKTRFSAEGNVAPRVGFEPTTLRLTAGRSTIELPRNGQRKIATLFYWPFASSVNPIR